MEANNLLALDIGEKRIGIARGNAIAQIAEPLQTFKNDNTFINKLNVLLKEQETDILIVGIPRNLSGQETAQSRYVRDYCKEFLAHIGIPIIFQDETLSTKEAEQRIGLYKNFRFGSDSLAAAVILEDYFKGSKI